MQARAHTRTVPYIRNTHTRTRVNRASESLNWKVERKPGSSRADPGNARLLPPHTNWWEWVSERERESRERKPFTRAAAALRAQPRAFSGQEDSRSRFFTPSMPASARCSERGFISPSKGVGGGGGAQFLFPAQRRFGGFVGGESIESGEGKGFGLAPG